MASTKSHRDSSKRKAKSSPSKATPARICAYKILSAMQNGNRYYAAVAPQILNASKISPEDSRFAVLLSRGVVSVRGSLDELINSVLKTPEDVQDDVRNALRIATYEMFYLKKEPYAVADQGVELVRYVSPRAARLANFVMRRLSEQVKDFPFGDVESSIKAASLKNGFPTWLAKQLEKDMGPTQARYFMGKSNKQASVFFAINENRVNRQQTLEALTRQNIQFEEESALFSEYPMACISPIYKLSQQNFVSNQLFSGLVNEGAIVLSDASAQYIASLALPEEYPERYLEIGAGNGTKSLMLQNNSLLRYGNQVKLNCAEVNASKIGVLTNRLKRAYVSYESLIQIDARNLNKENQGSFDAVFIDAPCSGVGTLRRHPEIRWRLSENDSFELAKINLAILNAAAPLVNKGGQLTYATCTPLCLENEAVLVKFLSSDLGKQFEIVPVGEQGEKFFRTSLTSGADIHFAAVLKRTL